MPRPGSGCSYNTKIFPGLQSLRWQGHNPGFLILYFNKALNKRTRPEQRRRKCVERSNQSRPPALRNTVPTYIPFFSTALILPASLENPSFVMPQNYCNREKQYECYMNQPCVITVYRKVALQENGVR
jgi:hypothetical protein